MTRTMTDRRTFLALTSIAAVLPTMSFAQGTTLTPDMMNRLSALAGFDPLPQDLLSGLGEAMAAEMEGRPDWEEGAALPDDVRERVLTALYTGIYNGETATRIGFSSALMWAAIEETNNVISYCGGLPGFWAEPPETT